MDHGVRDPDCDYCKRALGPLYHHKIKGNRHLPVFTEVDIGHWRWPPGPMYMIVVNGG